ncbi:MAG: HPF/RaiA family ribosome-associated protein [Phycisphaeraceae bacterium]|nr:HPF/RaiA family ribosome-associated protein [Phycisphaeraceae bacterium]
MDNSEHVDRHARERLGAALSHFQSRIERVDVLLEDLHGMKHGVERRCTVRVTLTGTSDVLVQHVDRDIYHAIDEAARRTKRTVRRRINRRRDIAHHRSVVARHAA